MNSDTSSTNTAHELSAVDIANDGQKLLPKASKESSYGTVDAEFKPLKTIFEPVINESYSKLGTELQHIWNLKISPNLHWDNACLRERLRLVEISDHCNDPQKEKQRTKEQDAYAQGFEIYAEIAELEIEAQKIEHMNPQDLAQDAHKKSERHRFKQEIDRLMQKLESIPEQRAAHTLPTCNPNQIAAVDNSGLAPALALVQEVEVAKTETTQNRNDSADVKGSCSISIASSVYPHIAEYKARKEGERNQPWSHELVEEVYKFHQEYGLKKTADKLGISQTSVTKHLSKRKKKLTEHKKHVNLFPGRGMF